VKVSYAALPWLLEQYDLLPCGGALGRGHGPLVVARESTDIGGQHVAVPGERTTAYLLMRLWSAAQPPAKVTVVPFAQIMPGVADGTYDAGLVIHEARFTYHRYGLTKIVDLGEWWEAETGLPIPLGAILARKGAVDPAVSAEWVRESVRRAWADPAVSRPYVLTHAQEMEPEVVDAHIGLYVNDFTADLGDEGYAAVNALLGRAAAAGITPVVPTLSPPAAAAPSA
jgi:1,4-dihydroxy-6-naphthoate synthase